MVENGISSVDFLERLAEFVPNSPSDRDVFQIRQRSQVSALIGSLAQNPRGERRL